jgi:hypothetical protein
MNTQLLVGTEDGLWQLASDELQPVEKFAARAITALSRDATRACALVDGDALWEQRDGRWHERAKIDGASATCLARTKDDILVGTERAHLLRVSGDRVERVDAFESVEGRDAWYTPYGEPAAVRSIAVTADGAIFVNVHVGGVVRSRDGGRSWTPTVDIEADVHQVLAHPTRANVVLAAAYEGFGLSENGGDSWQFITSGLHAHYSRAVAAANDVVFLSASTGFRGRRSALYRGRLARDTEFIRCREGVPWFDENIDTACLAASGSFVVFGTDDGRVFVSHDAGERWQLLTKGLPTVTCVAV